MNRAGRRYPFWTLITLGIIAGIAVLYFQQPSGTPSEVTPMYPASVSIIIETPTITPEPVQVSTATPEPDIPTDTALYIPSLSLYTPIIQVYLDGVSWDIRNLGRNTGHLQGTPLPGESGNIVLSAHVEMADGSQGPFAPIKGMKPGDIIEVTMKGRLWRYQVSEMHVTSPDDLSPVLSTGDNRLTLITCGSYDFFSNSYPDRYVVVALPIT